MIPTPPTTLPPSALAQSGDLSQGAIIMAVGMLVVFVALGVLMGVIALLNKLTEQTPAETPAASKPTARAAPAPATAPAPPQPAEATADLPAAATPQTAGFDPHLIAVLTAAATAALQRPVAVRGVRFASNQPQNVWARQGRRAIMSSHRPHRPQRRR